MSPTTTTSKSYFQQLRIGEFGTLATLAPTLHEGLPQRNQKATMAWGTAWSIGFVCGLLGEHTWLHLLLYSIILELQATRYVQGCAGVEGISRSPSKYYYQNSYLFRIYPCNPCSPCTISSTLAMFTSAYSQTKIETDFSNTQLCTGESVTFACPTQQSFTACVYPSELKHLR